MSSHYNQCVADFFFSSGLFLFLALRLGWWGTALPVKQKCHVSSDALCFLKLFFVCEYIDAFR